MLEVTKRDGKKVEFNLLKIENALKRAFKDVKNDECKDTVRKIVNRIERSIKKKYPNENDALDVEDIQNIVENTLLDCGEYDVAKSYIKYRYIHELRRQQNNDATLLGMIRGTDSYWSTENSNKNANLVTVQRDYLAGITSTDLAKNYILPKDVVEAHDAGIVHQHDMDYMAQSTLTNCFSVDTIFLTPDGPRKFSDFNDGDTVTVFTIDKEPSEATIRCFGEQELQTVTLINTFGFEYKVRCTRNHRWILDNRSITTNLTENDALYDGWNVLKIERTGDIENVWCVIEPKTHTFTLDCGIVTGNCELINLEDMLQNGTVINNVRINKPHRLSTAMTITTQIMASVAANTFGHVR